MAIVVLYSHSLILGDHRFDAFNAWSRDIADFAGVAVVSFFSISGYLIATSAARTSSAFDFVSKRVRRIVPGYAVALAFSAFVVVPIARDAAAPPMDWSATAIRWAIGVLKFSTWIDPHAFVSNTVPHVVNGSLWTVRYEAACYVLILAISLAGGLRRPWLMLTIAAAACAMNTLISFRRLQNVDTAGSGIEPYYAVLWVSAFLVGAAFRCNPRLITPRPRVAIAVAIAFVLAVRIPGAYPMLAPLAVPYVVLVLARLRCKPLERFSERVGGDYSYGLYLYGFPIQQLATYAWGGRMDPTLNFAVGTVGAVVFGILSWHLVEKHFLSRRRRASAPPKDDVLRITSDEKERSADEQTIRHAGAASKPVPVESVGPA